LRGAFAAAAIVVLSTIRLLKAGRGFVLHRRGYMNGMANDSKEKLDTMKHDIKDAVDEAKHRAQAAGEHIKREVAGDSMPIGDRIASNVKETVHKTQADIDAAKRDIRHEATNADDKV
jgi:gas vesicle protein